MGDDQSMMHLIKFNLRHLSFEEIVQILSYSGTDDAVLTNLSYSYKLTILSKYKVNIVHVIYTLFGW